MAQAVARRDEATGGIERVEQVLSNLDIEIFEGPDSRYTVCSTKSEPLFCYVRNTQEELDQLVIDTLTSYLNKFWDIEVLAVTPVSEPLEISGIPIEELTPRSRIRPTFNVKDSQGRQREFA